MTTKPSLVDEAFFYFGDDIETELREAYETMAWLREHIANLHREARGAYAQPPRMRVSGAYRSAYCIGADANCGARHSQCPGTYLRAKCTCWCH